MRSVHKQAHNSAFSKNISLDKALPLNPRAGAVNSVNERFDMVWIGKL